MHIVKSVGVLSVGKIFGLLHGCMGLIFAPIFLIAGLVGTMAGPKDFPFGGMLGIVLAVAMPIFYGGMGFVMGVIGALLYNLFAGWVGGFELELETAPAVQYGITVVPVASAPPTLS